MLSAATLTGGVLTIDFTATGATTESVTLSSDGTTITLGGAGFTGTSAFNAADINRISVRDLGGSSAQSLTLGGAALSLANGFSSIGVESFTGNSGINAGSAAVEVAADSIAISSTGSITTTNTVQLRGSSASRAIYLGAEDASRLSLTDAELDRITAGLVQIGSAASTGFISIRDNLSQANHLALVNNVASGSLVNIEFLGGITMAADKDLSVTALGGPRPIETFNTIVISTSGTGSLSMTANTGIVLRGGTTVTTEHGDLTLSANLSGTDTGLYSGVFLNGAIVETRGTGDIRLTGRGSLGSASGSQIDGVRIVGTSVVRSVSATNLPTQGEIVIDGTGGRGAGITIDPFGAPGDRINSQGGNITLLGRGGNAGSGTQAYGVNLGNGPRVIAANNASITIVGTGGIGGSSPGVAVGQATVQSANGSITIQGTGGTTTSFSANSGIELTGATILSNNGEVSLSGTGGSSTSSNYGISSNSSSIRSTTNKVSLAGAGGSGASSFGLWLDNNTPIFSGLSVEAVADSLNLPGSFSADMFSARLVSIRPLTAGTPIQLGSADVLTGASKALGLSSFEFGRISATTLRIGDATSGTISVVGTGINPPTDRAWNVELISGGDIVFNAPFSTVGSASASTPTRGNLLLAPGPTGGVKPKSTTNDAVTQTNLGGPFTTSFASGSDLKITINGLSAHTQYDRLTVLGRVNLAGSDLALSGSYVSSLGNVFTIVSAGNVTGTFSGQPENSYLLFNGRVLRVNYTTTTATLTDVGIPASIVPQSFSLPENTTLAGTVQSSPLPIVGETRTYAIVGSGPDDGLFTITPQGVLSFLALPDYETPNDLGGVSGDNSYLVSVRVTDRFGFSQVATMTVEVLPANDNAPVVTSPTAVTIPENTTFVTTTTATDTDWPAQTVTFRLVSGADQAHFVLEGDNQLRFTTPPDFEQPADADGDNVYEVIIQADDGQGLTTNQRVLVTVADVNAAPTLVLQNVVTSISESAAPPRKLAEIVVNDDGEGENTLSLSGPDAANFEIVGNELWLKADVVLDYETRPSYSIAVNVDDATLGGTSGASVPYTLTVTDANDAPVAIDDTATVNEDGSVTIDVLANDADLDGGSLTLVSVGPAAHGTAVLEDDGTITYTPNADFFGVDEFTYVVADGQGGSDTATVRVAVLSRADVVFAGRIYEDQRDDGVFNGSDSGLAGITVQLFDESNLSTPLATTVTDASGAYRFALPVGAGTYRIVRASVAGLLDGDEVAGTLGGVIDNTTDSRTIGEITVKTDSGDVAANGYDFGMLRPSRIQGVVFDDANRNGRIESGEPAIAGATVRLTGTDDRGVRVDQVLQTNAQGMFEFLNLRPSDANGYTLTETQPTGFADGQDSLGTVNGVVVGDTTINDAIRRIVMTQSGSNAINYNFGEVRQSDGTVQPGQTATIGFWQNKNGQALILSLNGGPHSKKLSSWLASTFPNLYGVNAGSNNLTGMTNTQIAAFYKTLFKQTGAAKEACGPPKLDAQVFAAALAAYVTNENLAGQAAKAYGFTVNAVGVGGALFNVGANGAAFGVANGSNVRVLDLLLAVNARSRRGRLFDMNGDGDTRDRKETQYRTMANVVFSAINEQGSIR
jgi:hypothetical protein